MADVAATLKERGSRYGNYLEQTRISKNLQHVVQTCDSWGRLNTDQQDALEMIAVKISRILNGDPDYVDNWRDIAGYATLVANRLEGIESE